MGMSATIPNAPRRKSTEETFRRTFHGESKTLDPEDFDDVFGGPPRSVLARQFSGSEFPRQSFFYEDIFRKPERFNPAWSGRSLPAFRIPATGVAGRRSEEFYNDVFGMDFEEIRRSRSRSKSKTNSKSMSKSNSSSVLSSEGFSPFRPAISDDDVSFSVFASKLRPINVPSKWNTSTVMHEIRQRQQGISDFSCSRPSFLEKQFENEHIENFKSTHFGFSRRVTSPETMSLGPNSYGSVKVSVEDLELNSPSSVGSSLCQEQEAKASKIEDEVLQEEEDDDEVVSSYVIEINSDHKEETDEALGVDEAIAWAKERFQSHSSLEEWSMRQHEKELFAEVAEKATVLQFPDGHIDGRGSLHLQGDEKPNTCIAEEEQRKMDEVKEMELLDEDIRLWSSGKERNIQLLLSTLHDILWPNSGWYPIPLTDLNESSHVKKAYQKARLCLHPDKLQQRGATLPQKYVAEKAFPILQDAWAAYISQDIIISA